jgi:hypothetical protein
MKHVQRVMSCITLALVLVVAGLVSGVSAETSKLSDAQFRVLAASPKTADDHTKLAVYYRAHAADHDADAKLHEDIVATSRKNKNDDQAWEVGRAADHYAEHSRETAEALRGLATIHEGIAEKMKKQGT